MFTMPITQNIEEITPLPWGVAKSGEKDYMIVAPPREVVHEAIRTGQTITSRRIAVLEHSFYTPTEVCKANAEMIVTAVNRAEKLEETLVEAAVVLEALNISVKWELAPEVKKDVAEVVEKIRKVIGQIE